MRHDETRARSEARAEAFEEAAKWYSGSRSYLEGRQGYEHLRALAARERSTHAPTPPVRYTETPEQTRASTGPWSASEGTPRSMEITDCTEDDGFTTAHVTGWPDSYPFEALDPWPDNPAEACK